MSKAFTDNEKELIRRRLLDQGYRLFSTYGLKKTNVEEIARATGISKGAFYGFYDSKETLFMDVIEQVETRVREQILEAIDLPGPSPRARLHAMLMKAFTLFRDIPILKFITSSDYALVFSHISPEKMREHLIHDKAFIEELFARCQQAGIPITVPPEQVVGLLYPLALSIIHEDDLGQVGVHSNLDLLLELIAAYCLGEIEIQTQGEGRQP